MICLDDSSRGRGNLGPEIGALLTNGAGDTGSLHFSLGVDDDTSVV